MDRSNPPEPARGALAVNGVTQPTEGRQPCDERHGDRDERRASLQGSCWDCVKSGHIYVDVVAAMILGPQTVCVMTQLLAAEGPFSVIGGIPVHPLVVHAAVVFVPLAAIGLLVMAVWPRFGARYGWIVWGLALVATGASFVAKESGEALEDIVGEPGFDHAAWGDRMPLIAGVLFLAALILWLVQRSSAGKALVVIAGVLAAVVAVFNLYWIVEVGHSGAKSVWQEDVASSTADAGS